jgi:hypothetical protein
VVWSLVDVRKVGSYFFNRDFPYTMSHNVEKSFLDLGTSYLSTRIYIKVTTPRKKLTDFVCRKANECREIFLVVNFKVKQTFRIGVYY